MAAADDGTTEVTMSVIASSLTTMVVFIPVLFIPGIAREIFRDLSFSIIFSNLAATTEVTMSVIASSLTTMVVFIPVLFIPGIAREIFRDLSFSIIFSNLAAVIVSLTLMPMVASRFLSNKQNITKEGKIFTAVKEKYLVVIKWAVHHRVKTIIIPIVLFIVVVFGLGRFLKVQFMPKQDQGRYSVVAELGKGVDIEQAENIAKKIEEIVKANKNTQTYFSLIQNDTVSVNVEIGKKDTRDESVFEIIDEIRPSVEKIPGIRPNLSEDFQMSSPQRDVEFDIVGPNLDELKVIGKQVMSHMVKYPGAVDVTSTVDAGNEEARVVLNREKIRSYGINPVTVGQTVSYFVLGGDRGDTLTVKTGTEEIDVLIRSKRR